MRVHQLKDEGLKTLKGAREPAQKALRTAGCGVQQLKAGLKTRGRSPKARTERKLWGPQRTDRQLQTARLRQWRLLSHNRFHTHCWNSARCQHAASRWICKFNCRKNSAKHTLHAARRSQVSGIKNKNNFVMTFPTEKETRNRVFYCELLTALCKLAQRERGGVSGTPCEVWVVWPRSLYWGLRPPLHEPKKGHPVTHTTVTALQPPATGAARCASLSLSLSQCGCITHKYYRRVYRCLLHAAGDIQQRPLVAAAAAATASQRSATRRVKRADWWKRVWVFCSLRLC